ncbi:MAG: zinc ABC transporter solute-binding protein [Alphaproteobacteria bacterium]|nr:zinc ABC transporter solute-binding protein [Alphaproteobacteria bacterium]
MFLVLLCRRFGIVGVALACLVSVPISSAAGADVKVVVSIKPVHGLVAGVMAGVGKPVLLVDGAASPHTYSLKPSSARALQDADAIIWVGHALESFLEKPLANLGADSEVMELLDLPDLRSLAFREGGPFQAHDAHGHDEHGDSDHGREEHGHGEHEDDEHTHEKHGHEKHGHEKHGHDKHADNDRENDEHEHESRMHDSLLRDPHIWLDPSNAQTIVAASAALLSRIDPSNASAYQANAALMRSRLDALTTKIDAQLLPVKDRPFVVFHDSYQYFETRFGVRAVGSITVSPEVAPGAERVAVIQRRVRELGAVCVFSEPQFTSRLIGIVREGTNAKAGTLDPLGAALPSGPDQYFVLMETLAAAFHDCLTP